ncbi:hypothetical protein [Pseudomonas sp. NFACC05-1]|uniref:hypothetical protein n=1 Tax=Pseudomonas sp. NFACC05-1 TaxID=1566241 RepID=UPI000871454C|nr:hypothetical protein [Pseudomonas sp. NFACC05-1]SCW90968.1 hypothetical protein SAMN03159424_04222 [Pseudomonas sp. NFACC05-1]
MNTLPYAWAKAQRLVLRQSAEGAVLMVCPSTPGWSISEVRRLTDLLNFVARELAPAGLRSDPKKIACHLPGTPRCLVLGLLRSPAGASSLATVVGGSVVEEVCP